MNTAKQITAFADKYIPSKDQPNALPELFALAKRIRQEILDDLYNNK